MPKTFLTNSDPKLPPANIAPLETQIRCTCIEEVATIAQLMKRDPLELLPELFEAALKPVSG